MPARANDPEIPATRTIASSLELAHGPRKLISERTGAKLAEAGHERSVVPEQVRLRLAGSVDYHLRKAFRKLEVKSRTQLARHVLQQGASLDAAASREPG